MTRFVLDCSVTMSWCFEDEADAYGDRVLEALGEATALVPQIWPLEVANVLLAAERRGRIREADSARFVELLDSLPINVDEDTASRAKGPILALGRKQGLTSYDAAYLELAMRSGLPLATRDKALKSACRRSGLRLFR